MDNLLLGPTEFDLEKSLLLEERFYKVLSELLLFGVVLKLKMCKVFTWDCSAQETLDFVPDEFKFSLHTEGLQQIFLHPEINLIFRCLFDLLKNVNFEFDAILICARSAKWTPERCSFLQNLTGH